MELDLEKAQEEAQEYKTEREAAEQKLERFQSDLEDFISCPISLDVITDPVVAADGYTYERSAIVAWLRHKRTSPVNRQPLSQSSLVSNIAMRQLVDKYKEVFEHA